MAEGQVRVGTEPVAETGTHHVARGRDRPGGHHAASRRGAAGTRAALPLFAVGDPAREGRGLPQGDDPTGEGPLRRHPGQARQHGVQAEGRTSLHFASRPQRRRRVAKPRHVQHCAALPLLAAGPGHQERDSLRHRHAGLLPCGLRPLGRHPPEREHGRPRTVGQRQVFRYQARRVAWPVPGRDRLRHRPGGRVRGHGEGGRWQGAVPRRPRAGDEPLRHRQGGLRGDASSALGACAGSSR